MSMLVAVDLFVVGARVHAVVPILYKSVTVRSGMLGTVMEVMPSVRVEWDDVPDLACAVVKRSQVRVQQAGEELNTFAASAPAVPGEGAGWRDDSDREAAISGETSRDDGHHDGPSGLRISVARDSAQDPLGLCLDLCDGRLLYVYALRPGFNAATEHNSLAPERSQLRPGDYILAVNGVAGDARAMLKEMEHSVQLHFVIRRPTTFAVELRKKDGILGLGLHHSGRSTCLLVEAVLEGPAAEWNVAHPDAEIRRGDRIVAVNGFEGRSRELLQRFADDVPFGLLVSRPEGTEVCGLPCVRASKSSSSQSRSSTTTTASCLSS